MEPGDYLVMAKLDGFPYDSGTRRSDGAPDHRHRRRRDGAGHRASRHRPPARHGRRWKRGCRYRPRSPWSASIPPRSPPAGGGTFVFRSDIDQQGQELFGITAVRFLDQSGDSGAFPLAPADYEVVVSRGPEYSIHRERVSLASGATTTVNATLVKVVDTTRLRRRRLPRAPRQQLRLLGHARRSHPHDGRRGRRVLRRQRSRFRHRSAPRHRAPRPRVSPRRGGELRDHDVQPRPLQRLAAASAIRARTPAARSTGDAPACRPGRTSPRSAASTCRPAELFTTIRGRISPGTRRRHHSGEPPQRRHARLSSPWPESTRSPIRRGPSPRPS